MTEPKTLRRTAIAHAVAALLLAGAWGLAAAQASRPIEFSAGATVGVIATDNQNLSATDPRAETSLLGGVDLHVNARSGRIQGFVDYALTGRHLMRGTEADDLQNALNGLMTAELVERRMFVDVAGQISQQRRSVFGVSSPDSGLGTGNLTEVRTFRIEPRVQGPLGSFGFYEARLGQRSTRSSQDRAETLDTTTGLLAWNSARLLGRTQIAARVNGNIYDFEAGRRQTQLESRLIVSWSPDDDLTLRASAGREMNDFSTPRRVGTALYGVGLHWQPTTRTVVDADVEHQYFGTAHSLVLSHRLQRLSFELQSSRSVVAPDAQRARGDVGGTLALIFRALENQFESDPAGFQRKLEELRNDENLIRQIDAGFLSSSLALQRRHELGLAWRAIRQTVAVRLGSSDDRRATALSVPGIGDAFAQSSVVRQRWAGLTVSHRLTPTATLAFDLSVQRTRGDTDALGSQLTSYALSWAEQWTRSTQVSVGARHALTSQTSQPYDVSTVYTTLRTQF